MWFHVKLYCIFNHGKLRNKLFVQIGEPSRLYAVKFKDDVLFLAFFGSATAIGLNTVVFPEAYGGDPETGASMTLVSHTLCVITIPLLYALMVTIFGTPFQLM